MSRKATNRLVVASLTLAAVAGLAACSGGSASSPGAAAKGGTIALWTHNGGNEKELAVNEKIISDFNASQTKYKVKLQSFPQESYNQSVVAAATAKKLPCIVDIDSPNVPNWAWAGYLAPLDLPASTWDGQLPSTVGTVGKKVYSYGHYDVALAMYARKHSLAAAGIRIPTIDKPWTKSEFADALAKLKKTGEYPFPLDLGTAGSGEWAPYAYSPFLQSFGGDLIDRKSYKSADGVLNGPEAIEWATWLRGLVTSGYIAQKSGADSTADFVNNKSAILYSGSWAATTVADKLKDDAVIIPPPDFGDGPKIGGGSWQWGMTTGCDQPAGALDYLKFAHQTKYFVAFANALGLVPATKDAAAQVPNYAEGGKDRVFLDFAQKFAEVRPVTPAYPVISSVFQKASADILSGGDPKTVLDKAVSDIDKDIKQNGNYDF